MCILWTLTSTHFCSNASDLSKQLPSCGLCFPWSLTFQVGRLGLLADPCISSLASSGLSLALPTLGGKFRDPVSPLAGRNSRSSCKGKIRLYAFFFNPAVFNPLDAWQVLVFCDIKGLWRDDLQWCPCYLARSWHSPQSPSFWKFFFFFNPWIYYLALIHIKVICHSVPIHRFISASWSLAPSAWFFTSKKLISFPNWMVQKNDIT